MAEIGWNGWKYLEAGGIAKNGMPGYDWQWLKMALKG